MAAQKKKVPGRPFKPGQTGNPKGSSAKLRSNAAIRKLTAEQVAEVGDLLLMGNLEALHAIQGSPTASALQAWTAAVILKGFEEGDANSWRVVLERFVGKVKETVELTGRDGGALDVSLQHLSTEEKVARADALAAARLAAGDD